jgi:hypothetical protein
MHCGAPPPPHTHHTQIPHTTAPLGMASLAPALPHSSHSCSAPLLYCHTCACTARAMALASLTATGSSLCLQQGHAHSSGASSGVLTRMMGPSADELHGSTVPCMQIVSACGGKPHSHPPCSCLHPQAPNKFNANSRAPCASSHPRPTPLTPCTSLQRSRAPPLHCPQSGTRCHAQTHSCGR